MGRVVWFLEKGSTVGVCSAKAERKESALSGWYWIVEGFDVALQGNDCFCFFLSESDECGANERVLRYWWGGCLHIYTVLWAVSNAFE